MGLNNSIYTICWFNLFIISAAFVFTATAQPKRKYFTGDNTNENEFNKISKSAQRTTRGLESLPSSFSLKQYAPTPGDQGQHGTCVAWSTGYAARTISYCIAHHLTDQGIINSSAFSPAYLYYYVKAAGDDNCALGAKIEPALKILTDTGDVLLSANIPDCIKSINNTNNVAAKNYTIKAYSSITNVFGRINKNEVIAIKKSITDNNPIIFSLTCYSSLFNVGKDGIWTMSANDTLVSDHAVCIVGYDDNKLGGAFEVMNSWGTAWGNNGFFWLTYDQVMQYGSYALEMMDREDYTGSVSRGLGAPQLKGSLDFVLVNDFGNDAGTMPVLRTGIDSRSSVVTDDNNADFSNYTLTESYPGGTKFKIKFTTNAPAFVYIFSIDNNKVVSTLFPYAGNVSPAINSTDATIYLPSEEKHYTLNADAERDKICVLYSKTALDFNRLGSKISNSPSGIYETIKGLFNHQIIAVKNINFSDNQISFLTNAAEEELVCFFIDMNHK
ncbi:MAG TPA: C1 family peptidase [Puia sp.]|nr:C1 family peptidase [Puia sp.]